ncbi:integrin alpha-6-like isoform X1 [Branchiostoma lanceolatum]|uniref:integrin alpha-6-like isoform X1 n=1 Tax=Branchiostoma lanceolatum TaxID=7740 RepID=UPI003452D862
MAPLKALPSVCFLGLLVAVSSFNLDTRDPVIKTMAADTEFGYSVAQHYITDRDEHVMLVGAPKANSQYLPGVVQPGTVYRCPVTSQNDDCTELNFDNTPPIPNVENKNKQFMGGAIAADVLSEEAGKVAICGHQYKKVEGSGDTRKEAPIGRCFFLENNLQGQIDDQTPFGDTGSFNPEEYGFAQAGTSVVFSPHWIPGPDTFTFSPYEVDIVLGNLGVYSWTGTVYSLSGSQNLFDQSKFAKKGGSGKNNLEPLGIDKGAMLGTSVACGKFRDFTSDGVDYGFDYIGGAPGYNQSIGGVAFFHKSIPEDDQNSDNMLFPAFILKGEQYKSDFGFAVSAIDLNNDGYDDLAVGAPQYIGEDGKGGAVYIYINPGDGNGRLDTVEPIKLKGDAKGDAFFGASLTRMGDMNGDGYQDLAVGAPYEESGKGAAYIFLGSSSGIVENAAQVIRSSNLSSPVRNFGIALSGGLDMDGNGYPDLLVGDGEGTAMLFRARPVVDLKPLSPNAQPLVMVPRLGNNPFKIKPDQVDCLLDQNNPGDVYACVDLKVSFQYDDVQDRPFGPNEIDIRYELEADADARNPRVFFYNSRNRKTSKQTHTLKKVAPGSSGKEKTYRLYLKKDERDLVTPVKVALKYWIDQRPPALATSGQSLPPLNNYPSLSPTAALESGMRAEKLTSSLEIEFFKRGCGENQICECDLTMDAVFVNLPQDNPVLRVTQDQRTVNVKITTSNTNEPAYSTRLLVAHSLGLDFNKAKVLSLDTGDVSCQPNALNQSVLECSLQNPLRAEQEVELEFSINSRFLTDSMMMEFELNTTSSNAGPMPNKVLWFSVLAESKLTLAGSSNPRELFYQEPKKLVGESAMEFEENIGPAVYHVYTLKNTGEGTTPRAEILIDWPYETPSNQFHTNGKWLLYIMDIALSGHSEGDKCDRPPVLSNPLRIKEGAGVGDVLDRDRDYVNITDFGNGIRTRERRDADEPSAKESSTRALKAGEKLSNLHCSGMPEDMARCERIRCTFTNIQKDIKVTIKARLWNNTLIMEYNQPGMVSIKSFGTVTIESGDARKRRQANVITQEVETMAVLQKLEPKTVSGIPWWIILLAVLAALLLLLLLALCLWKCGFFKRKKKETYEAEYYKATKVPKNVEYGGQPNYSVMQQGPQQGYEMQPLAGVPGQVAVADSGKYSVDMPPASPSRRVETTTTRYETRYEPVSPTKRSLHSVSGSGPRSAGYTQMTGSAWD